MRRRLLLGTALICLVAVPDVVRPAASAEQGKGKKPGLVVRVQAIDELLVNFKYLAALAGQEEQAKQIEGFIKSMAGPNGLEGIDTKRPITLYGNFGPNGIDSTAVLMMPVADEKAVLGLVQRLGVNPQKKDDGVYAIQQGALPVPLFFRFANKHAYVTAQDESAIGKDRLLTPDQVNLPNPTGVVSLAVNVAEVPDALRNQFVQQFEAQISEAKKKRDPGESDAQFKFKQQFLDFFGTEVVSLLKEGDQLALSLNIDRKANDVALDLSLTGKPNTKLAAEIAGLNQAKSTVAGIVGKESAFSLAGKASLPEELRSSLALIFDEGVQEGLKEQKDQAKRELSAKLAKAIEPTLKAGEIDLALDLRGPSAKNLYTVVAGVKVRNGLGIDKTLREMVKEMPAAERAKITLDAEQAGAFKIHRLEIPKESDENVRKVFGDAPLYVSLRDDALLIGMGENGLSAVKEALTAAPRQTAPLRAELSMARMAQAMSATQQHAPKAAQEAFGKGKDNDKILLSVEGGPALKVRAVVKAPVIKFMGMVAEPKGAK